MEVEFSMYRGFLIVEYSETDVKAYRIPGYFADNITSYEMTSQANIREMIDDVKDQGDFTDVEYHELMRQLGRAEPAQTEAQPVEPKHPAYIMEKVRQRLGLKPADTSRDEEINNMTHDQVFAHCLVWEGIIGYEFTISRWIAEIYGVTLS